MGLFGRNSGQPDRSGPRLPADFARKLDYYGRWSVAPTGRAMHEIDEAELYMLAQPNPDAFIAAVADCALRAGGWAAHGGARVVWNAVGTDATHPAYLAMLDAGIQRVERECGRRALAPFELRRLAATSQPH